MLDLRQPEHKLATAVVYAIAAFGDGQRDDANGRAGQLVDQCANPVLGQQHVADGADNAALRVCAVAQFEQGIEVILVGQIVAHLAVLGAQADTADAPVQIAAAVHQGIGVIRLVGAMKAAHADMGNALLRIAGKIGRLGHLVGEIVEVSAIEFHGGNLVGSGSCAQWSGQGQAVSIE